MEKRQLYPMAFGDGQLGVEAKVQVAVWAGVIMLNEKTAGRREKFTELGRRGGYRIWFITDGAHQWAETALAVGFFLVCNGGGISFA